MVGIWIVRKVCFAAIWALLFMGCAFGQTSIPTAGSQQLHGHLSPAIKAAPLVARLATATELHLAIGLPMRNAEQLSRSLTEIYDPKSAQYRHYLTPEQFAATYDASEQDYQAVLAFAHAKGLTVTGDTTNRLAVVVKGTSNKVEAAFHVTMNTYKRPDGSVFHAPDREPSLDLTVPVLHVSGLENYVLPHALSKAIPPNQRAPQPNAGSAEAGFYGGSDFRNAYAPGLVLNGAGQCVGLFEFAGFYQSDITAYETRFGLPNVPLQTVLLNGYSGAAGSDNAEVPLDIEMAIAMAPGLKSVVVFEVSSEYTPDFILAEMAAPTMGEPLCKQLSSSWTYDVDTLGLELLQEMAEQGQSFFNGSGDSGAYTSDPGDIRDQPYVTLVGGTNLSMNGNGVSWQGETAWSGSGGGILSGAIPSYQESVSMTANNGSTQYRNAPDVSMVGYGAFIDYNNGGTQVEQGTSIATPLWAGYMALMNQKAAMCGSAAIGFANPAVYAIAQNPSRYSADFHDITSGSNGANQHYNAATGYDLVTGLGTPQANLIFDLVPTNAACPAPAAPSGLTASPGE
jgi:subtilase family serine protease